MVISEERVRQVRSERELFAFLAEELHWPLMGVPVTYEFFADELGLTEEAEGRIGSVQQLANFVPGQPWGIFLVKFAGERVYQSALRRVLRGLSESRRDRGANLPAWRAGNLLFICTANFRDFSVARFEGVSHSRATLSIFGWGEDKAGLRTLCELSLPALRFPDDPADAEGWLKQWAQAFDVERVTKEFYRQYRQIFMTTEGAIGGLVGDARRLFAQKMFNHLLFIRFLEKKGWLTFRERRDYLRALWEDHRAQGAGNFFKERLEPLFFLALSTSEDINLIGINQGGFLRELVGDVPYLNGGLFEREEGDLIAGIVVPDEAIQPILEELFYRFNFTVTETTPLDIEVAVDPEMLGKIFEELVTGRHESGSYYTPKPVVAFMCCEALKGYLRDVCSQESVGALAAFVDDRDPGDLRSPELVLEALRKVRVCDPACGSGAYLLGMLHELLDLRAALFASHRLDAPSVYRRKLEIIQNNLYGVDKDQFAINIARLRLWLSLVVDYEINDIHALPALPNLDFKIEQGDSLSAPNPQALTGGMHNELVNQLHRAKIRYIQAHGQEKKTLKDRIIALRNDLALWLNLESPAGAFDWAVEFAEIFEEQVTTTSISGGLNLGFELAYPPTHGGFDIILANPPYVRQELIKDQKPRLKQVYPEIYAGVADLYCFFYARALQLLRPGGMLVFISPNKWFKAAYGEKLREYITQTCSVLSITDFGDLPVFESATAYPMIFIAQQGTSNTSPIFTLVKSLAPPYPDVLAVVRSMGQQLPSTALNGKEWMLTDAVAAKRFATMRTGTKPLGEYGKDQIFYGVKTGLNEAFVINGLQRSQLIAADPNSAEIIKPLAVGRKIRKWYIEPDDQWLIFARRGIDINAYPIIKKYLSQWKVQLEPKPRNWDSNQEWQGRKPGSYKWYEIQDEIAYYKKFEDPKIIYPIIAKESRFIFDTSGAFTNDKTYIISTDDLYLLGVLNSGSAWEYIKSTCSPLLGGDFELRSIYMSKLPIPNASRTDQATITQLVEKCLTAKGIGCAEWEREIDERVMRLYGLSP